MNREGQTEGDWLEMVTPKALSYPAPTVPSRALHWMAFGVSAVFQLMVSVVIWTGGWAFISLFVIAFVPLVGGVALRYRWQRKRAALEQHEELRQALLKRHSEGA